MALAFLVIIIEALLVFFNRYRIHFSKLYAMTSLPKNFNAVCSGTRALLWRAGRKADDGGMLL